MSQSTSTIGWIGAGVMGASMAGHLLKAGHRVRVFTRTRSKADALVAAGATWAESPMAAAEGADVVISMVGVPDDVREVLIGESGALKAKRLPRLIIDMTTSKPSLAVEIEAVAKRVGVMSLDAPVSGGDTGAKNAALSIMVGGELAAFDMALPLFQAMGKTIVHHGNAGRGQHTKMVNQILIASLMMGVCEGLLYAKAAGLDPTKVIESVGSGAAGSWAINNLGPRIVKGDFNPGFYILHFIKDLGIALEEAEAMKLTLPGLSLAKAMYEAARKQGHERLGTQALYLVLERMREE